MVSDSVTLFALGDVASLVAVAWNINGNMVAEIPFDIAWSTSNPSVATIDRATGLATADAVTAQSLTELTARVGGQVDDPPSVRVVDGFGNPVDGVTVTFQVIRGGGTVDPTTVMTSADAEDAGELIGSPVNFTATGVVEMRWVESYPALTGP